MVVICCCFILYKYFIINDDKILIKLDKCIDGDTAAFIINNKSEKVRFLGIDAPESVHPNLDVEEFGMDASEYTCKMLKNASNIYIEYDVNSDIRDKYDRILGWIFVDNNNLSELLLSKGLAEVKYVYGDYKYISNLCSVQEKAYFNKVGIWSNDSYNYLDNYCYKK